MGERNMSGYYKLLSLIPSLPITIKEIIKSNQTCVISVLHFSGFKI